MNFSWRQNSHVLLIHFPSIMWRDQQLFGTYFGEFFGNTIKLNEPSAIELTVLSRMKKGINK